MTETAHATEQDCSVFRRAHPAKQIHAGCCGCDAGHTGELVRKPQSGRADRPVKTRAVVSMGTEVKTSAQNNRSPWRDQLSESTFGQAPGGTVADGGVCAPAQGASDTCAHGAYLDGPYRCYVCRRPPPDEEEAALLEHYADSDYFAADECSARELRDDGLDVFREYAREISPWDVERAFARQECSCCGAHLDSDERKRGSICDGCGGAW